MKRTNQRAGCGEPGGLDSHVYNGDDFENETGGVGRWGGGKRAIFSRGNDARMTGATELLFTKAT